MTARAVRGRSPHYEFDMQAERAVIARGVLDHVEALTRQRDIIPLNISVLSSLRELLQLDRIRLCDVIRRDGQVRIALTAWIEDGEVRCNVDFPSGEELQLAETHQPYQACCLDGKPSLIEAESGGYTVCLPVVLDQKIGAFFQIDTPQQLTPHQLDVMEGIAGVYRNFLALLKDSQHDELTGLLNRKTFDHGMAGLLNAARQPAEADLGERRAAAGAGAWLAVIDIDYFKRINDQFGHLYGDEVLILMANLMRRSFRQQDKLYRFGGEEFVVLMRHIDYEHARKTLERFRAAVEEQDFPQIGQVTVSIGFAPILPTDVAAVCLGNADEALYYAKEHGRNQVQSYTILLETGRIAPKQVSDKIDFF